MTAPSAPQAGTEFDSARKGLNALLTNSWHPLDRKPEAFLAALDAAMQASGITKLEDRAHYPLLLKHHGQPQIIAGLIERGASLPRALDYARRDVLRTATDNTKWLVGLEDFVNYPGLNSTDAFLARIDRNRAIQGAIQDGASEDKIIEMLGEKPVQMLTFYTLAPVFDDAGLTKAKQALIDKLDPTITGELRDNVLALTEFPSVPDDDHIENYGLRTRAVA